MHAMHGFTNEKGSLMSWSFSVPQTTGASEFETAANAAKAQYELQLEGQDYALAQLASGQADEAIKAAAAILASGVVGDGTVTASLSGHAAVAGGYGTQTVSVSVNVVPVEPAVAAADVAPADEAAPEPAAETEAAVDEPVAATDAPPASGY